VYFSRDMGWTWEFIAAGRHIYEVANRGAILAMAPLDQATDTLSYSLDEGLTWTYCTFTNEAIRVSGIDSDPLLQSTNFIIYGLSASGTSEIIHIDFMGVHEGECVGHETPGDMNSDYEIWEPTDSEGDIACILGRTLKYVRRKRDSLCCIPVTIDQSDVVFVNNCTCTVENYECDYCFTFNQDTETCDVDPECSPYNPHVPPYPCDNTWVDTQGYRKVPGDSCVGGTDLNPLIMSCPKAPPVVIPVNFSGISLPEYVEAGSGRTGIIILVIVVLVLIVGITGTCIAAKKNMWVYSILAKVLPVELLPKPEVKVYADRLFEDNIFEEENDGEENDILNDEDENT